MTEISNISPALVDLIFNGSKNPMVRWSGRSPGGRVLTVADVDDIDALLSQLEAYEGRDEAGAAMRTREDLSRRLFNAIDGPERALANRLAEAQKSGDEIILTVRLLNADGEVDAKHPAAWWPWSFLRDGKRWLALETGFRLAVQLGPIEKAAPTVLPQAGVRILFMAYSPEGVEPVLDYEEEEERVLEALEGPLQSNQAAVHVVEDGTVDALERRLRAAEYDIVHLTGHGILTKDGPRLVMENDLGARDDVSPEVLLRALERGRWMPAMVMISSCHSAGQSGEVLSLAAALVAAGVPCVVGWVRPVRDDIATKAAAELYRRLSEGVPPAIAVRHARRRLAELGDAGRRAWPTLHLVTRAVQGFRIDQNAEELNLASYGAEAKYRYSGEGGRMKMLERGFVRRRRELQQGLRVLRTGRDGKRPVAGLLLHGMKGVGKSCLAARMLERHQHDVGDVGVVVLHGLLDNVTVLEGFSTLVDRWGDAAARQMLSGEEPVAARVKRLLAGPWYKRPVVIIVDDFEQNLELRGEGAAQLRPSVVDLVGTLLRRCRVNRPKLLFTSTATHSLFSTEAKALVEVPVGTFATAATRKLWVLEKNDELRHFSPEMWQRLDDCLGRNARVLDWARTLLRGESSDELNAVLESAETQLGWSPGAVLTAEAQQRLASLFLRTLAFKRATKQVSPDALTFVKRARVYDMAVPVSALAPLAEGLSLDLDRHVVALQNLGLLEFGRYRGALAHRVSPLVEQEFNAEEPERWHAVAAGFWWSEHENSGLNFDQIEMGLAPRPRVCPAWVVPTSFRARRGAPSTSNG